MKTCNRHAGGTMMKQTSASVIKRGFFDAKPKTSSKAGVQ